MASSGRLIQPYSIVTWGGENLSARSDGGDGLVIMAQNVKVRFSNDQAPTCSFDFAPIPIGFQLFTSLKEGSITAPITVSMGYPGSSAFTQTFQYVGVELTTGNTPAIRVECAGLLKGPFTDTRLNYTLEEPFPLIELPDFLLGKLNPPPDLSFIFTPEALEVAQQSEYLENNFERTPYSILSGALRPHGLRLDPGSSAFENVISISRAPDGDIRYTKGGGQPAAGSRRWHVVGPQLATTITRRQKFNIGQSNTKVGSSKKNNISTEQDQIEAQPPESGAQQVEVGASETIAAVRGPSNPQNSAESRTTGYDSELAKIARINETKILSTEISFTVPMLPGFQAIAPRDIIAVPSIKGPGDYIEDWEVKTVEYSQTQTGQINISVTADRPFTGYKNIADAATISEIRQTVRPLKTPELWANYYWS